VPLHGSQSSILLGNFYNSGLNMGKVPINDFKLVAGP
jgi:hypothetical protein